MQRSFPFNGGIMEQIKPEYRFDNLKSWEEFLSGQQKHLDKIAVLDLPRATPVVLREVAFHRVALCGETTAIIDTPDREQIIVKDRATVVVLRGNVLAKGISRVFLFGTASAECTNRASAYALEESNAVLRQSSVAWLYGEAGATLKDKAVAFIGEYASVNGEDESRVCDMGTTGCITLILSEHPICQAGWIAKGKYVRSRKEAQRLLAWAREQLEKTE